jgi:ketosteroid isomerase-like protein
MLTDEDAREFAEHWVRSWNAHDLDAIMSHYAFDVVLVSPVAARILSNPSGTVQGREALRAYFRRGLETFPDLEFQLVDVLRGLGSVVLYYVNQIGTSTGEYMELDSDAKVTRGVANYRIAI